MAKTEKKINEKAFKSLLHNIDPKNIAKILAGKQSGDDIVGKIFGKNQEEKVFAGKIVGDTATKLGPLEKEDGLTDMLYKIYSIMKLGNERRIKQKELENNYKEELAFERSLRHKEMMDAIKKIKFNTTITQTAERVETGSFLDDIIDFFNNFKLLKLLAARVPIIAILYGLYEAKQLLDNIDYGGNMAKNEGNIAQRAFREKVTDFSKFPLKQDEAKAILEQDEGPAKARDIASFGGIERITAIAEGNPDPGGIIPTQKSYEERRQEVLPMSVGARPTGEGSKAKLKQQQWDKTYSKDYNADGSKKTATPVIQEQSKPADAAAEEVSKGKIDKSVDTVQDKTSPVPSKSDEIPAVDVSASMEESPNQSVKLNNVINENLTNKLIADINSDEDVSVINNQVINRSSQSTSVAKSSLPSVRNLESTYQKMIYDSTRLV